MNPYQWARKQLWEVFAAVSGIESAVMSLPRQVLTGSSSRMTDRSSDTTERYSSSSRWEDRTSTRSERKLKSDWSEVWGDNNNMEPDERRGVGILKSKRCYRVWNRDGPPTVSTTGARLGVLPTTTCACVVHGDRVLTRGSTPARKWCQKAWMSAWDCDVGARGSMRPQYGFL